MTWTRVTACANIPPREGRAVSLGGREIAIFNLGPAKQTGAGDRFLAVDNRCPHKAGPLADGIVTGTSVVCPLHTWKISLLDGRVERPSGSSDAAVTAYPTRVEDGVVVVAIAGAVASDNQVSNLQDCQSHDELLHERRSTPPCPYVSGCVSSNPESPAV
jgi:nitrite reductase (NADH) small subunit